MDRTCGLCGVSLSGHRKGARFCSRACSAEASRLRRLLEGQEVDGFRSIAERVSVAQKRTQRLWEVA
jgi:hypothetical protein